MFYDDRHRNNPQEQAALFNEFFANQFSDASSYDIPIDFDEEDPDDIENDIDFSPEVIRNFLRKVKPAKAAGPDVYIYILNIYNVQQKNKFRNTLSCVKVSKNRGTRSESPSTHCKSPKR